MSALIVRILDVDHHGRPIIVEDVIHDISKNPCVTSVGKLTELTPEGRIARDVAREREHRAARILDELCVLKEEIRQLQKRAQAAVGSARRDARLKLVRAKQVFERTLQDRLGGWS